MNKKNIPEKLQNSSGCNSKPVPKFVWVRRLNVRSPQSPKVRIVSVDQAEYARHSWPRGAGEPIRPGQVFANTHVASIHLGFRRDAVEKQFGLVRRAELARKKEAGEDLTGLRPLRLDLPITLRGVVMRLDGESVNEYIRASDALYAALKEDTLRRRAKAEN